MHLIITDAWISRSRAFHLTGTQLGIAGVLSAVAFLLFSLGIYHWVFLKGTKEGWPIFSDLVQVVGKDDADQRERYLRENIDAMAKKLGEMQAKVLQLESLAERVSGLAGLNPNDIKGPPGRGGALVAGSPVTLSQLDLAVSQLNEVAHHESDYFTVIESRLFDQKMKKMMIPTQHPVVSGNLGSAFGWRVDPITGRSATHEGLDFQADHGTPIVAAATGVVVTQEYHAAFGNMIEIDHGNDLLSRYAHASRVFVKKGDLIKRGQKIAEVGTTGRSTGPHLHFEVLVQGVAQDPQKFLKAGARPGTSSEEVISRYQAKVK